MVLRIQVEPHPTHVVGDLRKVQIAARSLQHDARGDRPTLRHPMLHCSMLRPVTLVLAAWLGACATGLTLFNL